VVDRRRDPGAEAVTGQVHYGYGEHDELAEDDERIEEI
jgi:hypothetical protein